MFEPSEGQRSEKKGHRRRPTLSLLIFANIFLIVENYSLIYGQKPDLEPEFLAPLENHTVTQGRDVYFTCVVNHLSAYKVAWIKSDTKAILAIHTHLVAHNQRLSVTHNGHNTWKLHVCNVQKNDSGTYMCQINTDPMRSQMGHLEVVIPPDILNEDDSSDSGIAVEGGSVRLRCRATGVPEPTVLWRREDSRSIVFRHESGREKQVLKSYDGDTLLLNNIHRSDMGAYLCIASNGIPPSVSKRFIVKVHFQPLIKVTNQLVAAPAGSAVNIQCNVESSPKSMNSWRRDTGEKLMPSDKYVMEEFIVNEYILLMNLTIKNLEKRDFGGYICTASNALDKADGLVRLQELDLPVKTTTVLPPIRYNIEQPKIRKTPVHTKNQKSHKHKSNSRKPERKSSDLDEIGSNNEELDITTSFSSEPKTAIQETPYPSASRSPPLWNDVNSTSNVLNEHCVLIWITYIVTIIFMLK